jgi:hypothetical protein
LSQIIDQRLWKYVPAANEGVAAYVAPDSAQRPRSLKNRVIATEVRLADESRLWALLENVDVSLPDFTKHWLIAHFLIGSRWWKLARYHDLDADQHSPQALATRLGKRLEEVFPIHYDIASACSVSSPALSGTLEAEPAVRLKRAEIIRMAVPKSK